MKILLKFIINQEKTKTLIEPKLKYIEFIYIEIKLIRISQ